MENNFNSYLTFVLGQEKFAIPVDYVQEIVEFGQVTRVPHTPDYMLGIINLRGRVLPLLDTKLKLGLPVTQHTSKSRIMVLDLQTSGDTNLTIGALVDLAKEVVEISGNQIQESPEVDNKKKEIPITGIVNDHGDITMIMDIHKVFSVEEIDQFNTSLN